MSSKVVLPERKHLRSDQFVLYRMTPMFRSLSDLFYSTHIPRRMALICTAISLSLSLSLSLSPSLSPSLSLSYPLNLFGLPSFSFSNFVFTLSLPLHVSLYLSSSLCIHLPPLTYLSIFLPLSVSLTLSPCISIFLHLSVSISLSPHISLSFSLSLSLSFLLSLSLSLSIFPPLF